jgi:hypothetical protein
MHGFWRRVLHLSRRTPKALRLRESLALGERRFVAVLEFEQTRFLIGGTASSLVLLSRLEDEPGLGPGREGYETERIEKRWHSRKLDSAIGQARKPGTDPADNADPAGDPGKRNQDGDENDGSENDSYENEVSEVQDGRGRRG